jgi:hypothetical protein
LFLCLTPFLWVKVSDLSASPLLSACCDGLLIVFQFSVSFDFGCCSLVQEISFVDRYLFYCRQWLITIPLSDLLPFQPLFTESLLADQLLALPPFSGALSPTLLPLLCVSFQFLVYCSLFYCSIFCAGLSQWWLGEYCVTLGTLLFGLPNVSQAGLELASGSRESSPVFSV